MKVDHGVHSSQQVRIKKRVGGYPHSPKKEDPPTLSFDVLLNKTRTE
jgi:hypothetical protein